MHSHVQSLDGLLRGQYISMRLQLRCICVTQEKEQELQKLNAARVSVLEVMLLPIATYIVILSLFYTASWHEMIRALLSYSWDAVCD